MALQIPKRNPIPIWIPFTFLAIGMLIFITGISIFFDCLQSGRSLVHVIGLIIFMATCFGTYKFMKIAEGAFRAYRESRS